MLLLHLLLIIRILFLDLGLSIERELGDEFVDEIDAHLIWQFGGHFEATHNCLSSDETQLSVRTGQLVSDGKSDVVREAAVAAIISHVLQHFIAQLLIKPFIIDNTAKCLE